MIIKLGQAILIFPCNFCLLSKPKYPPQKKVNLNTFRKTLNLNQFSINICLGLMLHHYIHLVMHSGKRKEKPP